MRDPDRINELLELLGMYWHGTNTDLRLGQILGNLNPNKNMDSYYLEDDVLIDILKIEMWGD